MAFHTAHLLAVEISPVGLRMMIVDWQADLKIQNENDVNCDGDDLNCSLNRGLGYVVVKPCWVSLNLT